MKQIEAPISGVIKPIKLRSLTRALGELMGAYKAAVRGNGIEFDDSRRYVPGDDPRMILWKKSMPPDIYVKTCREERDLRITLLLDVSASMEGLKNHRSNFETMKQTASLLIASAVASGDRIALGCFADKMLEFTSHKRGLHHALSLLETIDNLHPIRTTTNLDMALKGYLKSRPKRSLLFIITDGIYPPDYEMALGRLCHHHDVIFITPLQVIEKMPELSSVNSTVPVVDPETGRLFNIPLSNRFLSKLEEKIEFYQANFKALVLKKKASFLEVRSTESPLSALRSFFERRRKLNVVR